MIGIDLENIVYYKDDTHYFVMTAKKQSLLEKGVILHVSDQRVRETRLEMSLSRTHACTHIQNCTLTQSLSVSVCPVPA